MKMVDESKIAIIVDFAARNNFTHHIPLIQQYSLTLGNLGWNVNIFVPAYADPIDFKDCSGSVRFNLYSLLFGPQIQEKFFTSLMFKLIERVIYKKKAYWLKKIIMRILIVKPLLDTLMLIRKYSSSKEFRIVFPTTDPLSIDFGKFINRTLVRHRVTFCYRLVGSESRGSIATGNELIDLAKFCTDTRFNVRIGIETEGYKNYLLTQGFQSTNIYWSPWPQLPSKTQNSYQKSILTLGFFGTAKKIKGFDLLPRIFTELVKSGLDFKAFVQGTIFPWPEYLITMQNLQINFPNNVDFTNPILDLKELQDYISACDFLVLPYNPEAYKINGSGLQYQAADANVPVIVRNNTGSSLEVIDYNLGFGFDDLVEIPNLLKKTNYKTFETCIRNYNNERNSATVDFLN